jgi:hypothetical protein
MHTTWNALRGDAAANYGLEEGWREEKGRKRMGPLAEQTPTGVRNRDATERMTARRVEAFVTEGSMRTADTITGEVERREEDDKMQGAREREPTPENMDELLEAVAEAISEAERATPETQEDS